MDSLKGIISYQTVQYGHIRVKLAQAMDSRGITRNHLRTLTGVKYDVITRYYRGEQIERVDLDFLAKVCYVLNCQIGELLEYVGPEDLQALS